MEGQMHKNTTNMTIQMHENTTNIPRQMYLSIKVDTEKNCSIKITRSIISTQL